MREDELVDLGMPRAEEVPPADVEEVAPDLLCPAQAAGLRSSLEHDAVVEALLLQEPGYDHAGDAATDDDHPD